MVVYLILRHLQSKTKIQSQISLVDYYLLTTGALLAHTENEAQKLFDLFSNAARCFGLTVSLKKTEVMLQSTIRHNYTAPGIKGATENAGPDNDGPDIDGPNSRGGH